MKPLILSAILVWCQDPLHLFGLRERSERDWQRWEAVRGEMGIFRAEVA